MSESDEPEAPGAAEPSPGEETTEPSPTAAAPSASESAAGAAARDDGESGDPLRAPLLSALLHVPLQKLAIWAAFVALLFILWDFFGLIFLTFVLSYIASSVVDRLSVHFSSRKTPVLLVFALIIGAVVGLSWAGVARAVPEVDAQIKRLQGIDDPIDFVKVRAERAVGRRPVAEAAAAAHGGTFGAVFGDPERRGEEETLLGSLATYVMAPEQEALLQRGVGEALPWIQEPTIKLLRGLVGGVWKAVLFLLLALVFSFMIVWDAPRLAAGVSSLQHSRLGAVWSEVAPSIATFARLVGRAFEAQTMIAVVNTVLTAIGMLILGVPGIGFLSAIVFLCSFVPILGVYVSTAPIALVALQEGGLGLLVAVIVMVTVVHVLEAYVLNPRIYGAHMKLHPLIVLMVLFIGQNLIGLWGLILGVPLATYVWRHLILGQAEHVVEPPTPPEPATPAGPRGTG